MPPLIWRALFGVVMALTFHGWGALLDDLLQGKNPARTPVARGALGLAVVLALGGVLNFCHLLIGPVYGLLLGIGAVYAGVSWGRQLRNRTVDWKWCAIVSIGAFLLLPVYLQSLDTDKLNHNDDYFSYLVMPMRILQLGTLQPDAFNYRAAISGPGGMAFLQAPVVGLFGVNAIRMVDQGCGLLLLIGAAATLFRRYLIPVSAALVLLAGGVLLAEHALVNVTSYFTSLALLVALVHVLWLTKDQGLARPVFAALLLAGIAALKNTAVPFAALLCLLFVIHGWWQRSPHRLRNMAIALSTASVITLVWYAPRLLTKVQLLPLSHGDGPDQVSLAYMFWWVSSDSAWNWIYLPVFLAAWGLALFFTRHDSDRSLILMIGLAALAGNLAMTYLTGGVAITRYTQPLMLVGYLLCATLLLAHIRARPTFWLLTALVGFGFVAFRLPPSTGSVIPEAGFNRVAGYLAFHGGQPVLNYFEDFATSWRHMVQDSPIVFPTRIQSDAVRQMQAAMVPGATALVHTDLPFLLDFKRNQIWVVDIASASPPPGMPLESSDGQKLVGYLRTQSIRYIAYAYGNEAGFPTAGVNRRLSNDRFTPWQRALNRQVPLFHDQLRIIAARWPKVYDDGQSLVIDISASPALVPVSN